MPRAAARSGGAPGSGIPRRITRRNRLLGLNTVAWLALLSRAVEHAPRTRAQAEFVCPNDAAENGWADGDKKTYFCCKPIEWGKFWCTSSKCVGLGCDRSAQSCPPLDDCLCKGITYKTRSSCSLQNSCEQARQDYQFAQMAVLETTGLRVDEFDGCQQSIMGVLCAYHFPRCKHDFHEQEKICMKTCQNMMDTCARTMDCKAGGNVTKLDEKGQPVLDEAGNEVVEKCNASTSLTDKLSEGATAASDGASDAANAAASAAGGERRTGSDSLTRSPLWNMHAGGQLREMGDGWNALEAERKEAIFQALRRFHPDLERYWRKRESSDNRSTRQRAVQFDASFNADIATRVHSAGIIARGGKESRLRQEDSTKAYYAQFEGKVKLSDFAQVGSRCEQCLTKEQLAEGKMCEKGTPEYECFYNKRFNRNECTSGGPQAHKSSKSWYLAALSTISWAAGVTLLCFWG